MSRVVGSYSTEGEAIDAIENLKREGYRTEDISVLSKDARDTETVTDETDTHAEKGAVTGAVGGEALGGLGGLLAGLGAIAVPGFGPVVAAGPISAGLGGTVDGADTGGVAGALIGSGMSEEEAKKYEMRFNDGQILVFVEEQGRSAKTD